MSKRGYKQFVDRERKCWKLTCDGLGTVEVCRRVAFHPTSVPSSGARPRERAVATAAESMKSRNPASHDQPLEQETEVLHRDATCMTQVDLPEEALRFVNEVVAEGKRG